MQLKTLKNNFAFQLGVMAAIVGIISAIFTYLVDRAHVLCLKIYAINPYIMFIYIPVIFVMVVYILKKYFPYADGSGLPQGYAVDVFDKQRLKDTYSIRTMIGKILLTIGSILAGASLGKEGPTIQVCASLFSSIKNITDEKRRLLIKLGSGVGVAAAFNCPIGGMVFAIEEYVRQINAKIATTLVAGTVVAVYATDLIIGNKPYMGEISQNLLHPSWTIGLIAIVIGSLCGLLGALFTKIIVFVSVDNNFYINRWRKKHYLFNAIFWGLMIALIGYFTAGYSFGNGADSIRVFLGQNTNAPWYFAGGKYFGAISSVAAGVPGGYFSTALSIGAGIGDLLHQLLDTNVPLVQFYLLGMTGFLAAITQSPITSVAMVVEMSNSSQFSLPILFSAFLGSYIAEKFGDSVYHQQVLNYIDKNRYEETRS